MKKPNLNLRGIGASFRTRSFRVGGYSVAATVIVIAIAIVINLLAGALPEKWTQFDTSSNQLYTLSDQTEKLVSGLEQEVTIYWVARSGYEDSTIGTILDRYAALSSQIHVEKKDPDVYPTFVQQYTDSVSDNSLIVVSGERSRYVDYTDIYVYDYYSYYYYGTTDVSFAGESELTSAIDYVINADLPKMYLLTGHGESSLNSTYQSAVEDENIISSELSLLSLEAVPEDADCILICAPQSDIAAEELEILRNYLASGGKIMLVSEPLQDGRLDNLEALMADYGVTAAEGIVIEGSQSNYAFGAPYYLLPEYNYHTITSALSSAGYYVLLPIAQGLTVSGELADNLTVKELLVTSDSAFSKTAGYDLSTYDKEDGDVDGPFSLAVAITDSDTGAQLVWVSSSGLLDASSNTRVSGGNLSLFLNCLNWMCGETESTISVSTKSMSYEYLTMDSGTSSVLTVMLVGIIPAVYLCAGIVVFVRRKRR